MELFKDTQAMQIHPKTQQEIGTVTLPRGTKYRKVGFRYDQLGFSWKKITVKGYVYEIAE